MEFLTSAAAKCAWHQGSCQCPLCPFFYVLSLRSLLISKSTPYLQAAAAARVAGRWPKGRPSIVSLLRRGGDSDGTADEKYFEIVRDILLTEPAAVHEKDGFVQHPNFPCTSSNRMHNSSFVLKKIILGVFSASGVLWIGVLATVSPKFASFSSLPKLTFGLMTDCAMPAPACASNAF